MQRGTSVWLLLQGSTWAGGPGQRDWSSAVHHRPLRAHMAGAGSTGLHAAGSQVRIGIPFRKERLHDSPSWEAQASTQLAVRCGP